MIPELKRSLTGKDYVAILKASRKRQLLLTATNVQRIAVTFDAAAESIAQRIAALPGSRVGTPWHRAQLQLLADIRTVLEGLRKDYRTLLDVGMLELAQNAADREAAVAEFVSAAPDGRLAPTLAESFGLTNGQSIPVEFGRLSLSAVERVTTRYYKDGLVLSDRLWKLDARVQRAVADTVTQGLIEGTSARDLATRLRRTLAEATQDGLPPPRHQAMRIARTEVRNAWIESAVAASEQSPGVLKDYISGLRWNLSMSHSDKDADVCDLYATRDNGAGPGIYIPQDFPVGHPACMCFSTSVLKAFPDSGVGGAAPRPDDVPDSQRRVFNEQFPEGAMVAV